MKIIEALKAIKRLREKVDDLREKIHSHCAHTSLDKAEYGDKQRDKIQEWINSYRDTLKEIARLKLGLQKTNLETMVTIEIGDNKITEPIAYWILRRRELAGLEHAMWQKVTSKHLKAGSIPPTRQGGEPVEVTIVTHFDPEIRDKYLSSTREEPLIIDATLEVVNATTELIVP